MKKITCEKAGRLMMLAVYGEADPRSNEILRAHRSVCPGCEAELRSLERLSACINFRAHDDISGELLARIKGRSAHVLPGGKGKISPGRLILRPVLALAIIGIIIFSFSRFKTPEVAVYEDHEYRMIDERLVEAENSLYAINIDLLAGFNDF